MINASVVSTVPATMSQTDQLCFNWTSSARLVSGVSFLITSAITAVQTLPQPDL